MVLFSVENLQPWHLPSLRLPGAFSEFLQPTLPVPRPVADASFARQGVRVCAQSRLYRSSLPFSLVRLNDKLVFLCFGMGTSLLFDIYTKYFFFGPRKKSEFIWLAFALGVWGLCVLMGRWLVARRC
ncbi:hypothetical protein FR483_n078L [Paramecium bursaria Chlorella virus FR483]|uniref:Uncharacterized protein n078L n=1 Tax=Paramecium bursaria Chlorella virus FR483 TaxID=399781 RepID=A7J6D2_PBCVF|nr:hypothetical protein FR483_n078L [Paramecium bursaria Chlorella virus FR483]ABT15363.1 hypothetical protein FR483_n078L [Paramecium bursaria Chlorella virus FR483]